MEIMPFIQMVSEGGLYTLSLVVIAAIAWKVVIAKNSWGERFVRSAEGTREGVETVSKSLDLLSQRLEAWLEGSGKLIEANAVKIDRQERAGVALCGFLRSAVDQLDIPDESKAELKSHVDKVQEGLTK